MTIGISGHQDLGSPKEVAWISARLRNELSKRTFSRGVSSLAVGADQLFAHIVLDLHHALEVVLPCRGYEKTFKNDDMRKVFAALKSQATHCQLLEFDAPSEEAFYRAGQRVVDLSDLMMFVWDGKPAKGRGGTADIVDYAIRCRRPYVHIELNTFPE